MRRLLAAVLAALVVMTLGATAASPAASVAPRVPRFDHIVVVIMENHGYSQIIGSRSAPYTNALARHGALFANSVADYHPSQPNYLALFSGSPQGVHGDACPNTYRTPNLARSLLNARLSFSGYSEGLPRTGWLGCSSGAYARKHNPWSNFANVPAAYNRPLTAFPADYRRLPTVSFVIPNLVNDMHDGSVLTGDRWLQRYLGRYAAWARSHRSLLVLTWDEDDFGPTNRIATVFYGANVKVGAYRERIDHYRVLRTIEDAYRLRPVGNSARVAAITSVWTP